MKKLLRKIIIIILLFFCWTMGIISISNILINTIAIIYVPLSLGPILFCFSAILLQVFYLHCIRYINKQLVLLLKI